MSGGSFEDDFPTVGGVKAHEGVGEQDDHKGFGGVTESRDQIVDEGFEDLDLLSAVGNQPSEGDD